MKIIYTQNFQNQFYDLLTYIAKHNPQNALNFEAEISSKMYVKNGKYRFLLQQ